MSEYGRYDQGGTAAQRPSWGPGPPPQHPGQQRGPQDPGPRPRPEPGPTSSDGSAVKVLRVTAYVLTSLASLLFIVVVIYGAVQLNRLSTALEQFGSGIPGLGASSAVPPDLSTDGGYIGYMLTPEELSAYCPEVPDDPACAGR